MTADRRIPVTVVTGFLGSGKTTIIRHLLAAPGFQRCAVIVNEFGDIDFNEVAFARAGSEIVSANSGCFCCTARAGIAGAFRVLASQSASHGPFEQVLIETSGLSAPAPILQAIINDPDIVTGYRLRGVIAVVDAVTGLDSLNERREAREQVAFAGAIVVSKVDVADRRDITLLRARIAGLNAAAPLLESRNGAVDPKCLHAATDAFVRAAPPCSDTQTDAGRDHAEGAVSSWTVTRSEPATRTGLALWMDLMAAYRGSEVLRMKGIVNVEGRPVAVESVRHVFHPPVDLADWPDDDRRSRVVVIAAGIDRDRIDETFDALAYRPVAAPLDRDAYRRFQTVMSRMRSG